LIDNTTAANRAANIPEFVNVSPDGFERIGGPVMDYFRLVNRAAYLQRRGQYDESMALWRQALANRPDDEFANRNLGMVLMMTGRREESAEHLRKAAEMKLRTAVDDDPRSAQAHAELGAHLAETGRPGEAAAEYRKAVELKPDSVAMRVSLGEA